MTPLLCMHCTHWRGTLSDFSAECGAGVYTALVPFDRHEPPCAQHSGRATPAPAMPPQMPAIVQMFVPTGGKP